MPNTAPHICLVNMPFVTVTMPSMALSLLSAILRQDGLCVDVAYANLWFLESFGLRKYQLAMSAPTSAMAGEWSFAEAAFRHQAPDPELALARYDKEIDSAEIMRLFRELRASATLFLEQTAQRIAALGAPLVGCTSTFEQHVASLALLRRIKELSPSTVTLLGGANCETEMGDATHRNFPWVDFVISGEADGVVTQLVRDILEWGADVPAERLPACVAGPAHRRGTATRKLVRGSYRNLDSLPYPDYDDYFSTLQDMTEGNLIHPGLPLEMSRGCWWGAKHHCTFCGLNGTGMAFNAKSPARVVQEIHHVEERYHIQRIEMVDNILDVGYFRSVLPALKEDASSDRSIFFEVKANLTRHHVADLVAAGVRWVQPGIESLHSQVLKLMDKGIQGWQNIQLLKWSREFGMRLSWSLLWGFPGEEDAWYDDMRQLFPLLAHLQAPTGVIQLRYDRFSVYHRQAELYGLQLQPVHAMAHVYPLPLSELQSLGYFFTVDGQSTLTESRPAVRRMVTAADEWKNLFYPIVLPPVLGMEDSGEALTILDTRPCKVDVRTRLEEPYRSVLLACDAAPPRARLSRVLAEEHGLELTEEEVAGVLTELHGRRFIVEWDGRVINLVLRGDFPRLPTVFPGGFCEPSMMQHHPVAEAQVLQPQSVVLAEPFELQNGYLLPSLTLGWEAYGRLSPARDNVILVCPPLTGGAHAAGRLSPTDRRAGWWDAAIGPGRMLDTNDFYVLCMDPLGGGGTTSGPAALNPETGQPYGTDFPRITVRDIVEAQRCLLRHLGIERLHAVLGGGFGAHQALMWSVLHGDMVERTVALASGWAACAHTIALFAAMETMIVTDSGWQGGHYYGQDYPWRGMAAVAAMSVPMGMTPAKAESMFGRRRTRDVARTFNPHPEFEMARYVQNIANRDYKSIDPNALLYLMRAEAGFDLAQDFGSLAAALGRIRSRLLLVSFRSDWRLPSGMVEGLERELRAAGVDVQHHVSDSPYGHAAIRQDVAAYAPIVSPFLSSVFRPPGGKADPSPRSPAENPLDRGFQPYP